MAIDSETYKAIPELNDYYYNSFWGKANLTANPDKCWDRPICQNTKGYGRILLNGKLYYSHRVAYFSFYKVDPREFLVLHKCDNPKCVNPNHLFLGTSNDNVQDMILKGRDKSWHDGWSLKGGGLAKGSGHPFSKLLESDVMEIRKLYSKGNVTQSYLSKKFKIASNTLNYIVHNKTWKHV